MSRLTKVVRGKSNQPSVPASHHPGHLTWHLTVQEEQGWGGQWGICKHLRISDWQACFIQTHRWEPTRRHSHTLILRTCLGNGSISGLYSPRSHSVAFILVTGGKLPHLNNMFKGIQFSIHMGPFAKSTEGEAHSCPGTHLGHCEHVLA